jgi:hypothetical protein
MQTKLIRMGKKKPTADRHKKSKMVRIKPRLATQGELLAERLESDFTKLCNDALREKLEREGMWPPPDAKQGK